MKDSADEFRAAWSSHLIEEMNRKAAFRLRCEKIEERVLVLTFYIWLASAL